MIARASASSERHGKLVNMSSNMFEQILYFCSDFIVDVARFAAGACKFSSGFLETSRVTAVQFCETVVQAAKNKTGTPDHYYDNYIAASLISEWMTETWATEICSAVVSRLEEPPEGINQLQTNQRPEENMTVHPNSRAWYLLEGDRPGHRSLKVALKKVCHDECEDLVMEMGDVKTLRDMLSFEGTMAENCAAEVVRKVEAETLGCCARSCGWNGATCGLWRFMSHAAQQDWKLECCAEGAILNGSFASQPFELS